MEDLSETTFIIPTYIDSGERLRNLKTKLNYLLNIVQTTVVILEHDHTPKVPALLDTLPPDVRSAIHHHFVEAVEGDILFYRTKLINEIFTDITTPVVCLAGCDAICPPESYSIAQAKAQQDIPNYPYSIGPFRHEINAWGKELFELSLNLAFLDLELYTTKGLDSSNRSEFFINRKQWLKIGLENENLIYSNGEPSERALRVEFMLDKPAEYISREEAAPLYSLYHPPSSLQAPFIPQNQKILGQLETIYNKWIEEQVTDNMLEDDLGLPPEARPEISALMRKYITHNASYLKKYGFNL